MYDGATAIGGADGAPGDEGGDVVPSGTLHPHYVATTETLLKYLEADINVLPPDTVGDEDVTYWRRHGLRDRPVS